MEGGGRAVPLARCESGVWLEQRRAVQAPGRKGRKKKKKRGQGRVCQIRVRCIVSHARSGRVWPEAVFRILVEIQVYPAYQSRSMTQAFALPSRQDKHIDT